MPIMEKTNINNKKQECERERERGRDKIGVVLCLWPPQLNYGELEKGGTCRGSHNRNCVLSNGASSPMSHRHLYTVNLGSSHPWLRLHQHYFPP